MTRRQLLSGSLGRLSVPDHGLQAFYSIERDEVGHVRASIAIMPAFTGPLIPTGLTARGWRTVVTQIAAVCAELEAPSPVAEAPSPIAERGRQAPSWGSSCA